MAQENVKKFMEKYVADEALQEQLKGKKADEVVAIAGNLGFAFTKEELEAYGKGLQELTPDQLEQAAGGDAMDAMQGVVDAANWAEDRLALTYNLVKDFFSSIFG